MSLNIIIFKGPLITLNYFIDQFINFVIANKINYYIADLRDESSYTSPEFEEFAKRPGTVMFTFNNVGVSICTKDQQNFWKAHDIPVYNWIQDHPRNYDSILSNPPCEMRLICLDRNHIDYINRFFPYYSKILFLPNGGTEVNSSIPFTDRKIDVIYMGDCQPKLYSLPKINAFPDGGASYFETCIGYMIANTMTTAEEAISQYIADNNLNIDEKNLFILCQQTAPYIELLARRLTKISGIKALDDAGVHVDIYGTKSSWIDEDFPFSENIQLHDRIDIGELMPLIGESKISLCFTPWYKRGCSEKEFDSMLNGALCVTDRTEYLEKEYRDGENIIFFDPNSPEQMANDVMWLLSHPQEAQSIASAGFNTAKNHDTWDDRCSRIIEDMNSH